MVLPAPVGGADDRDRLAGLDPEGEILNQRLIGRVAEPHVLEFDHARAVGRRGGSILGIRLLVFLVEQREHALG